MNEYFLITYDGYASKRSLDKFRRLFKLMMENGLYRFYLSYSIFLERIRAKGIVEAKEFQPLKLEQLYFFVTIFIIQMIMAIIVFIIELVVHCMNIRRQLRHNISSSA